MPTFNTTSGCILYYGWQHDGREYNDLTLELCACGNSDNDPQFTRWYAALGDTVVGDATYCPTTMHLYIRVSKGRLSKEWTIEFCWSTVAPADVLNCSALTAICANSDASVDKACCSASGNLDQNNGSEGFGLVSTPGTYDFTVTNNKCCYTRGTPPCFNTATDFCDGGRDGVCEGQAGSAVAARVANDLEQYTQAGGGTGVIKVDGICYKVNHAPSCEGAVLLDPLPTITEHPTCDDCLP
jgi:hypothetical protein